jgi:hypothetical protein
MEARFAGSQRVGDRRRRRLAAGADDNADNPNADNSVRPVELSAPTGSFRAADSAHTEEHATGQAAALDLPLAGLVPAEGWKYVAGGLLGLAIGSGIVITGYLAPRIPGITGTAISELLALPNGRLAQWFSSLLLLLSAQLALLVWWARSRSLEDYEGRYWLWIRTAGFWLAFSGCVSIEAHNLALSTLLKIQPGLSHQYANLCWMIPVTCLAALLVGALVREMCACRTSRALVLVASACLLSAAGLRLEFEMIFSPLVRGILIQAGLLTGYVSLFVSMWLHARHVLHFSADPAPRPRRNWRIPRPHFRISPLRMSQWRPMLAWRNRRNAAESLTPAESPKARRKKQPAIAATAEIENPAKAESIPSPPAAPPTQRTSKPRIRFDARHLEALPQVEAEDGTPPDPIDQHSEQTSRDEQTPDTNGPSQNRSAESKSFAVEAQVDTTPVPDGAAEPDETADEGPSKPELRGLSKKQRRRLMQEMRDRERDSNR